MKTAILIAVAFVFLSSLPLFAHSSDAAAQQQPASASAGANESAHARASHDSTTSDAREATMRSVHAELVSKLDAESTKTGDTVVAKAKMNGKAADGKGIVNGSRLAGQSTNVQAHARSDAE